MVKIDKISVKNFKNIESADVIFGPLNVIVGPNGSGKSNFLMITSFLDTIINGSNESVNSLLKSGFSGRFGNFYPQMHFKKEKQNDIRNQSIEIGLEFSDTVSGFLYFYDIKICLKDKDNDKNSDFKISNESLSYKQKSQKGKAVLVMSQKDSTLTIHKSLSGNFASTKVNDSYISGIKILDIILKTNSESNTKYGHIVSSLNVVLKTKTVYLSSHALKYFESDSVSSYSEGRLVRFNLEEQIKEIHGTDKWKDFIEAVKSITKLANVAVINRSEKSDSNIIRDDKFVAYFYKSRLGFMRELSDGEILILALIAQIVTNTQDIIFFEELENSIHPKALENLIRLMNHYNDSKQFLISTHSVTLLNMVKPENVFVTMVNDADLAEITMISDIKDLKRKLSQGFINFGELLYQGDNKNFEDILDDVESE